MKRQVNRSSGWFRYCDRLRSRMSSGHDAAVTLWWRWPALLSAGTPFKETAELERMVSEKFRAAAVGVAAAQAEMVRITANTIAGKNTADASTRVLADA